MSQAADEETLPFKMVHCLGHELGLRVYGYPESTHSSWNDCRNALRRSGLQYCLLLSGLLANCSHGPYGGGKNRQTLEEAAEDLQGMSAESFDILLDEMTNDMRCDHLDSRLPRSASDIATLPAIQNLPAYAGPSVSGTSNNQQ